MRITSVAATAILCAASHGLAQQDYRFAFFLQPTLGGRDSIAWGIGVDGSVVGSAYLPDSTYHATIWMEQTPIDLGTLGGQYSSARDINSSGWVVGWAVPTGGGLFDERATLWRDGQIFDLGTLGGDVARAHAVNELGDVVGQSYIQGGNGRIRAFLWHDERMENLEWFDEDGSTFAYDINDSGQIVGRAWRSEMFTHRASLWVNGRIADLGTVRPDNTGTSEAYSINDLGQVVGFSQGFATRYTATLWFEGKAYDLGTPNTRESEALGINNLGQVVGAGWTGSSVTRPFLWDSQRGMEALEQLVPPSNSMRPYYVWGINDAGQIAGTATPKGAPESRFLAFLMSPVNPTMEMAAPVPGAADVDNTITVTGATPSARVHFLYSRQGGGTRIPGCDLQQNALQLDNPTIIGTAIADANGIASITRNVPLIARGQTILFQAVVQNECAISQLVVHQFE